MVAAYFKTPVLLAWRALVANLSIERGHRITGQEALAEAMVDYFIKHGQTPPAELVAAAKMAPPTPVRRNPKPRTPSPIAR